MRVRLAIAMIVAVSAVAARAQEPPAGLSPSARAHFERGMRLYGAKQYAEAAAEFKAGHRKDPRPEFLYALAQAERLGGNCKNAIQAYEELLRTGIPRRKATTVKQHIAACRQRLQEERAPEIEAPSPPPSPSPASPPAESVVVRAGPSWLRDPIGHALVGAGVAAVVVGAVLLERGWSAIDDSFQSYDRFAEAKESGQVSSWQRQEQIGVALLAAGGALVVAGIVRYVLHSRPPREPPSVAIVSDGRGLWMALRRDF